MIRLFLAALAFTAFAIEGQVLTGVLMAAGIYVTAWAAANSRR
ncbi:hypothetical protein ACGFYY_32625 [Streptomyces sp. NPDC048331]